MKKMNNKQGYFLALGSSVFYGIAMSFRGGGLNSEWVYNVIACFGVSAIISYVIKLISKSPDFGRIIGFVTLFLSVGVPIFYVVGDNNRKKLIESMKQTESVNQTENLKLFDKYFYSGFSKDSLGDFEGAIEDFTKAIELDSNIINDVSVTYNNRGLSKFHLKDYGGAITDYNKAIELNPNDGSTYQNRGTSKYELEDYRGAIADFTKAIELNPNDSVAYYNRGFSKYNLNDLDGACLDWSKAGELGDENAYETIKEYCN